MLQIKKDKVSIFYFRKVDFIKEDVDGTDFLVSLSFLS